jgi:hypothetical protein
MDGAIVFLASHPAHHDPDKVGARLTEGGGPVNSIMTQATDRIPSTFAMPVCAAATSAVREHKAGIGTGIGTALAQGYFPGTSAWRPPSC